MGIPAIGIVAVLVANVTFVAWVTPEKNMIETVIRPTKLLAACMPICTSSIKILLYMWHMVASYSATHVDAQEFAVVAWSYV